MDLFGNALSDFYVNGNAETLWLYNSYGGPEEMPIDIFFRNEDEMPTLEHKALSLCYGKVLDVGAGVGSHALILQELGFDVTAIDVSAKAVTIMKERGVQKAFEQDIFTFPQKFDTLLFLMNGIGLTKSLAQFKGFLDKAKELINPDGQLIFDSSDISYLYEAISEPSHDYFGEVGYCYEYKGQRGAWFNWLYIDQSNLKRVAKEKGWNCEIIFEDDQDQYLARLKLMTDKG